MLLRYFEAGGPVMYGVLALWVVVLAAVLDRLLYLLGRTWRRPLRRVHRLADEGRLDRARAALERERERAARRTARIDGASQLAVSVGLFGTVLGLARSFFARGGDLELAAPEVLASGLATALYTTVAGLAVFLAGQLFLFAFREWEAFLERRMPEVLAEAMA